MKRVIMAAMPALLLSSCKTIPPSPETLGFQVPDGMTLWLTEAVPQIGSVVRVSKADNSHRGTIVSNALASGVTPVAGSPRELTMTASGSNNAKLALSFFKKIDPTLSSENSHSISLTTSGTTTWNIPPETEFKNALVGLDRPDGPDPALRAMIARQKTKGEGGLFIVTAIYIAETAILKRSATDNFSAGVGCNLPNITCGEANFKRARVVDGAVTATGAPIFVRLKWVGQWPSGVFGWADDTQGPKVVSGS